MFDSQNKNFNSEKSQADNIDVSNLPLRTMEKDLKNMDNPNFNVSNFMPEDGLPAKKETLESNLNETQKTSPFLSPSQSQIKSMTQTNPLRSPAQNEENIVREEVDRKGIRFDLKKLALFSGAIIIVLAGIASAYYFMKSSSNNAKTSPPQQANPDNNVSNNVNPPSENNNVPMENGSQNNSNLPENNTQNSNSNNPNENTTPVQESINADKPNFIVIDSQIADKVAIQVIINKKIDEVKAAKIFTPVEFIISDNNFAPVNFQDFSKKIGLALPAAIAEGLKTTFSFFISNNESNQAGVALLIDIQDGKTMKPLLLKEEPQLVKELDFLFLGKSYQTAGIPFSTNNYKNNDIRYYNIQKDASMSVDYAILNNRLLLATSKMTALGLVDKLLVQ